MLRAMAILLSLGRKLRSSKSNAENVDYRMDAPVYVTIEPTQTHSTHACSNHQEQQRELKKAQKEAAKAKKKAAAGGGGDSGAPPSSAAKSMAESVPDGAAGATAATVQFCVASPPTVAHAACSLTSTSMAFVLGEVRA